MSLTQQMSPDRRRRRGGVLMLALVVLAIVIAGTVLLTLTLSHSGSKTESAGKPAAGPAPTRFGIPSPRPTAPGTASSGTLVLPRAAGIAPNGVPLGFPHTTLGAVSAAVRWIPLGVVGNKNHQEDVLQTIGSPRFRSVEIPKYIGGYSSIPPNSGLWVTDTPFAQRILSAGSDSVTVAILSTYQAGDQRGSAPAVFSANSVRMVWIGDDWRLDALDDITGTSKIPSSSDPHELDLDGWKEYVLA